MLIEINGTLYRPTDESRKYREAMERAIDEKIPTNYHVHHLNKNRKDNRLDNLQIMTAKEHMNWHRIDLQKHPKKSLAPFITVTCRRCGKEHRKYNLKHIKEKKQINFYCSAECCHKYIQENKAILTPEEIKNIDKGYKEKLTKHGIAKKYGIDTWKIYKLQI